MKAKQYVKKYRLSEGIDFNYHLFLQDFTSDFIALVEYFRAKGEFTVQQFDTAVDQMRDKWDGINNKTLGKLPEKLWNYFYASVVVEAKNDLFPKHQKRILEIKKMSNAELQDYLHGYGVWVNLKKDAWYNPTHGLKRAWEKVDRIGNEFVTIAMKEADRRAKILQVDYEEELHKRDKEWYEQQQKSREGFEDWFERLLLGSLFKGMQVPTSEFAVLGLKSDASEEDVKKAYRKLSLQHHPDQGGNQAKFIELTEAKNKCIAYAANKV